jgi:hypothetical protein
MPTIEEIRERHKPFRIYDECDCTDEQKRDDKHKDIMEVGLTCNLMYVVCAWCCADQGSGYQSMACAEGHEHTLDEDDRCDIAFVLNRMGDSRVRL